MCGISFIFGPDAQEATIKKMVSAQTHRGPDKCNHLMLNSDLAFGHNRLSIIDLSDEGSQPMISASGRYTITFNGEIYNYKELRTELYGYNFKSETDTEVLLAAWEKWGVNCLPKLIGMFAFAIWDDHDKELILARDWIGIKPFYLSMQHGSLYGASEIKGLLAAGISSKPDWQIWGDYFRYGVYNHSTRTFFDGVVGLETASYMRLTKQDLKNKTLPKPKKYWNIPSSVEVQDGISEQDLSEKLWDRLEENVKLHIRSDVPLGLNLSGGMDSATLCLLMDGMLKGDQPLSCFTMVYGSPEYDEIIYADSIPKTRHWERHEVLLTPQDAIDNFEQDLFTMEEPIGGVATQAYRKLHEYASNLGIKVLLEGQGVDELLGGYGHYKGLLNADKNQTSMQNQDGVQLFYQDNTKFLAPELIDETGPICETNLRNFFQPFDTAVENAMSADLFHRRVPRVLRMNDRVSMAHSVELREPFLTQGLAEFCYTVPIEYKVKPHQAKSILKTALDKRAPEFAKSCENKRGVSAPQREWLRGEMKDFVYDTIREKSFCELGAFNIPAIHASFDDYIANGAENSFYIWQWLNLAKWLKVFK